jgi:hypothetical protein
MRDGLQINHIFPIKDAASARLMLAKAECMYHAGLIDAQEMQEVASLAAATLGHDLPRGPEAPFGPRR